MVKSIRSQFISILLASVVFITAIMFSLYKTFWDDEVHRMKEKLVSEEISMILSRTESNRLNSEFKEVSQALYKLILVEEVVLFDKDCKVLITIPFDNRIQNCNDITKKYMEYDVQDTVSSLGKIYVLISHNAGVTTFFEHAAIIYFLFFSLLLTFICYFVSSKFLLNKLKINIQNLIGNKLTDSKTNIDIEFQDVAQTLRESYSKIQLLNKEIIDQEKNKFKFEIAQKVAHDIQSPLGALKSLSLSTNLSSENKSILDLIIKRIESMAKELLDVKSMQVEKLNNLLEEIIKEKEFEYNNINLKIRYSNASHVDYDINYGEQLKRILSNLINNSLEAQQSPFKVLIGVELVLENAKPVIKIIDNGPGFSQEILTKVFNAQKVSSKSTGHGIGLSSARSFLLSIGGDLQIENNANTGACIILILP